MLDEAKSLAEKYSRPGAGSALFREGAKPPRGSFAAQKASASANHKSARTGDDIRSAAAGFKNSGGKRKADESKADWNYPEKRNSSLTALLAYQLCSPTSSADQFSDT